MVAERTYNPLSGWFPLIITVLFTVSGPYLFIRGMMGINYPGGAEFVIRAVIGVVLFALAFLFQQSKHTIGSEVAEEPVEVNAELINLCSRDQVVRTGCAGDYKIRSFFFSTQLTYHFQCARRQ